MIALLKVRPYAGDIVMPSPNHGARRAPVIRGIVLHATADAGNETRALSWLRSPKSRVSCHLLVGRAGRVIRLVGDRQRAWHAGLAWWRGTSDVNSITLGIEIANRNDGEPYTDAQYGRVAEIVAHYCRQGLSLDDVVSHGEIAEGGRRTDPLGWDWERFRAMVRQPLQPTEEPPPIVPMARTPGRGGATTSVAPPVVASVAPRVTVSSKRRGPVITVPKPVLRSRTLWLNGTTVLASGGMLAAAGLDLAQGFASTPSEDLVRWALFGVGLVNIVLRLRTDCPIACGQGVDHPGAEPGSTADCVRSLPRARQADRARP